MPFVAVITGASAGIGEAAARRVAREPDARLVIVARREEKLQQLAAELSNQYRVTYARPQRLIPPKDVEVSARRSDLRARGMLLKTEKERQ